MTPQPTWESYYNYAEELYAAGYQNQAKVYYRQAQLLFKQAEEKAVNQNFRATGTHSYSYTPPQARVRATGTHSYSYTPPQARVRAAETYSYTPPQTNLRAAETYSYAPPQAKQTTTNSPAMFLVPDDVDSIPTVQPRHKRSLKRRIRLWLVASLSIALLVSIGGFVGLFYFYKHQLRQKAVDASPDTSILGQVQAMTLTPMVGVLQPSFDKLTRLALAVQPLLYELKVRGAPPEDFYLETLYGEHMPEAKATMLSSLTATRGTNALDDIGVPREQTAENTGTSPTPSEVDGPDAKIDDASSNDQSAADDSVDAQADAQEGDLTASDRTGSASDAEEGDVDNDETVASSSRSRSRRSARHRSERSARPDQLSSPSTTIPETQSAAPVRKAPVLEETPPSNIPPLPDNNSKTRELDDLLKPKAKASKPVVNTNTADKSASLTESLSRTDVQQGMSQVAAAVKQCGQGKGGAILMNVAIKKNGRVSSAIPSGIYAGTHIGACVTRAVRRARFPATQQNLTVKYPFKL